MRKVQPIPSELLIHQIAYTEFIKSGSFGEEFKDSELITNVTVQYGTLVRRTANNVEIDAKGVIYLDRENTPNFKPLKEKSIVEFHGSKFRVVACDYLYDFNKDIPHHYEVVII